MATLMFTILMDPFHERKERHNLIVMNKNFQRSNLKVIKVEKNDGDINT